MKISLPIVALYALAIVSLASLVFLIYQTPRAAFGSVSSSNEYAATTTNATSQLVRALRTSRGSLGQVTITGANTGTMTLYDATTSDATKRATSKATTTLNILADFPASAAAGTYTFDAAFTDGLLLVSTGLPATSTITHRQ